MSELLRRVRTVSRRRKQTTERLDREYIDALEAAAAPDEEGWPRHSQAEIAEAAGVTQQAVSYTLKHAKREER